MVLKRRRYPIPDYVNQALKRAGLEAAYKARPDYQQNDYIWWITSPKLDVTRQKRLKQMLDELKGGTKYMNMDYNAKK